MTERRLRVSLPSPPGQSYTYRLPEGSPMPPRGSRVVVPFGRSHRIGFVDGPVAVRQEEFVVRAVAEIVDDESPFTAELLAFMEEAARYYLTPVADFMKLAASASPWPDPRTRVRLTDAGRARVEASEAPALLPLAGAGVPTDLLGALARRPLTVATLRRRPGLIDLGRELMRLVDAGLVALAEPGERRRAAPAAAGVEEAGAPITLSAAQERAVTLLGERLTDPKRKPVLLYGVTASGKTEVYIRLMRETLAAGGSALLLAPEIALSEALQRVVARGVGRPVAMLHSGLGESERRCTFERLRRGELRVAMGPRSALFAPLTDLRLIVVDEEHEPVFKSQQHPRYSARDLAVLRAHLAGALVVLGSATPSVESWYWTVRGKYERVEMTARARGTELPSVELVDMRAEFRRTGHPVLVSSVLVDGLEQALGAGHQGLVLLNRRGYASVVLCRQCGKTVPCSRCSQALVYHRAPHRLICHLCGETRLVPRACPGCQGDLLEMRGAGTERVHALLCERFPAAKPLRVDSDLTHRQAERALARFAAGDSGILVGTQMIAKGHDFQGVTVVGVLGADAALSMPDFRGAERTFSLLTQVAGRAGRGGRGGRVVVQCWNPDHYALELARSQDYPAFFERELRMRSAMLFPPRAALAQVLCAHRSEDEARALAERLAQAIRGTGARVEILGPCAAFRSRVKDLHRFQLLLRSRQRTGIRAALAPVAAFKEAAGGAQVLVDIDPVEMF